MIGSHLDSVADAGPLRRHPGRPRRARGGRARCDRRAGSRWWPSPTRRACASRARSSAAARSSGGSTPDELELRDADGVTLRRGDRRADPARRCSTAARAAYFEVHIEQGPVLEAAGLPLGVVTAIAGQTRFNLAFDGQRRPRRDDADGPAPRRARRGRGVRARGRARRARRARAGGDRRRDRHPARRGQRDPGPRRRARSTSATRTTPCASARSRRCAREADAIAQRRGGHRVLVGDRRARRHAVHARAGRARSPRPWPRPASRSRELPSGAGPRRRDDGRA